MVWLRAARAEAARHSGQRYAYPAVHATSQTSTLPGSCSQAPCSAEENGRVAGELHHGSAGALASQEGHALNHRALRAEALLGGRGGKGACSREGVCIGGDHTEFYESFSHSISGLSFLSFPDPIPAAGIFSSWEVFPCPMSFPCQLSQTPSQPLCTPLGPTETCLFAGHCLGSCSCLQVEKGRSEQPRWVQQS